MYGTEQDTTFKIPAEGLQPQPWMFRDYSNMKFQATNQDDTDRYLQNVLTWWQQTTWLLNVYMNNMDIYLSVLSFVNPNGMTPEQKQQYALALYLDGNFRATGAVCPQQLNRIVLHAPSKRRFYRAVMSRLLDTKMLQFAKFRESLQNSNDLFDNIWRMWSENLNRTLEESLEVLEIFDFTSNFMLLHVLQGPDTLVDWMVALRDGAVTREFESDIDDSLLCNWMSLLPRLQPYLSPFDILSAFRKDKLNCEILHFFASLLAISEHDNEPPGMVEIENNVSYVLKQDYDVADYNWYAYRYYGWRYGARGKIFEEHVSVDKIVGDIIQFRNHGHNWWEFMTQAESVQSLGFRARIPDFYVMKVATMAEECKDEESTDVFFTIAEEDLQTIKSKEQSIRKELVA